MKEILRQFFLKIKSEIDSKLKGKADNVHNHDDRYYTESEVDTKLSNKVDKVSGKELSTNDYTTAEKNKLAGLNNYDDKEVRGLIKDEITRATTAENNLSTSINNVKSSVVTSVDYDSTNKKITKTINGTISDVVTLATMKDTMALNNVTNVATESTITKDSTKNITSGAVYTLKQTVDGNKSAIDTLNGTGIGSVKKTVTDEIAKIVANAPSDFDTLKEISDWIDTHEDSASAMNTQINANKSDIADLKTSVAGKSDTSHKHSASDITSGVLPVANGGTGVTTQADINKAFISNLDVGNSDVTDGTEFVSSYASDNGFSSTDEGSLHTPYKRQFVKVWNYIKNKISSVLGLTKDNYSGTAATILDYVRGTPIKVRWGGAGIDSAEWYPAFNADGSAIEPINRANIHAGTADYAKNMYQQTFDLTSLDKTKFYPLVCSPSYYFAEVAILSEGGPESVAYNQNRIHFDISTIGWSDTPFSLNIREYACYDNNEITIGCIGRGIHNGAWAIWLRGGLHYTCFSRNSDLSLHTSDYTYGDETYTVGTNYYGGSNANVDIIFTPQSTIKDGAYSSKQITATEIKANNRMVIPIGAPSSLQDGDIWIER